MQAAPEIASLQMGETRSTPRTKQGCKPLFGGGFATKAKQLCRLASPGVRTGLDLLEINCLHCLFQATGEELV